MIKRIERLMSDKKAAAAVEYALIAGGLATAIAIVALRLVIR
jgi:Flp pilus assembly pilin Flp